MITKAAAKADTTFAVKYQDGASRTSMDSHRTAAPVVQATNSAAGSKAPSASMAFSSGPNSTSGMPTRARNGSVPPPLASNSTAVQIAMALDGCGIARVPHYAVAAEIAAKRLEVLFRNSTLSPEHMFAYVAKAKRLPAKTADFISRSRRIATASWW